MLKIATSKVKVTSIISTNALKIADYLTQLKPNDPYYRLRDFDVTILKPAAVGTMALTNYTYNEQTEFITQFDFIYRFHDANNHPYALIATVKGNAVIKTPDYQLKTTDLDQLFQPVLQKASWLIAKMSKLQIDYTNEYTFDPKQFHLDFKE